MAGGPVTRAERDALPDDGHRHELIDGALLVTGWPTTRKTRDAWPDDGRRHELVFGTLIITPRPSPQHESLLLNLGRLLGGARADVEISYEAQVELPERDVLVPDLLVTRAAHAHADPAEPPPLLVVEVLDHQSRSFDLHLKPLACADAGIPSYWVVDSDALNLTAWDLVDGAYVEVASVTGDEEWTASRPFPVTIAPARLRD